MIGLMDWRIVRILRTSRNHRSLPPAYRGPTDPSRSRHSTAKLRLVAMSWRWTLTGAWSAPSRHRCCTMVVASVERPYGLTAML